MVYFIGAGPGAADLITVRGMNLIKKADVIIYAGSLVNPKMLEYAGKDAEIYNSAHLNLDQIIDIIKEKDGDGKTIVRLHTGEPSLYGAVKEQMDRLDELGIRYESCPGVTACFGAAASLNMEYTLPGISQSLIITRIEGKTKVPESESLRSLAAHKCSMAIYLSAGHMDRVRQELLAGGMSENTPVAIVYKATWKDEKIFMSSVRDFPEIAEANNITKTALIIVGDAVSPKAYRESRLYAPDFTTEYRKGTDKTELSVISFTKKGIELSGKIKKIFEDAVLYTAYGKSRDQKERFEDVEVITESLDEWTRGQMQAHNSIVYIGAMGIAVRAISPYVKDKLTDSPVVVIDELGLNVIPVLSGHIGRANVIGKAIADGLGSNLCLTTATDVEGKFAVDNFALTSRLGIGNRDGIARINSRVLDGNSLRVYISDRYKDKADIYIGNIKSECPDSTIRLSPERLFVGVGCKKGKKADELICFVREVLDHNKLFFEDIEAIASIDLKKDEEGIIELSRDLQVPFFTYSKDELLAVEGEFTESDFVYEKAGVGNVCERAAKACALEYSDSEKPICIIKKTAHDGMTVAVYAL